MLGTPAPSVGLAGSAAATPGGLSLGLFLGAALCSASRKRDGASCKGHIRRGGRWRVRSVAQPGLEANATDVESKADPIPGDLRPPEAPGSPAGEAAEPLVSPSLWNNPLVRASALISVGALAGQFVPFTTLLHVVAYGIWIGTNVWTTFVAGLVLFQNLSKKMFGKLQGALFVRYFQLGSICNMIMLITSLRIGLPVGPALVSMVGTLLNLLYLEPESRKIMATMYKFDEPGDVNPEDVDKDMKKQFNILHGISSLANLVTLCGLLAHGSLLAARL